MLAAMAFTFEHRAAEITLMAAAEPGLSVERLAELLIRDAVAVERAAEAAQPPRHGRNALASAAGHHIPAAGCRLPDAGRETPAPVAGQGRQPTGERCRNVASC